MKDNCILVDKGCLRELDDLVPQVTNGWSKLECQTLLN